MKKFKIFYFSFFFRKNPKTNVTYSGIQVVYDSVRSTCNLQKSIPEGNSCQSNSDCLLNRTNTGLICDSILNICSRGYNSICLQNSDCANGFTCYSGLCQCVIILFYNIFLVY